MRLASVATAADTYAVSTRTVRRWISDGLVTGYHLGPNPHGPVRVDLDQIETVILRPIPNGATSA